MIQRPNSESYRICRRMFHKIQDILFDDSAAALTSPAAPVLSEKFRFSFNFRSFFQPNKIREHAEPTLVGLGCILGGMVAPMLLQPASDWVLKQSNREISNDFNDELEDLPQTEPTSPTKDSSLKPKDEPEGSVSSRPISRTATPTLITSNISGESELIMEGASVGTSGGNKSLLGGNTPVNPSLKRISNVLPTNSPSLEELHRGKAFSFGRFVEKAAFPTFGHKVSSSQSSSLDLERRDEDYTVGVERKQHLMNSHYFHSEMQFVLSLMQISVRLCGVPKPARQVQSSPPLNASEHLSECVYV